MPHYRMLAIDIDGTLVNSRDELTEATRAALATAAAGGIRVVLATGRRYSRTLPFVEPLGIDSPLVTASGALIKSATGHQTLFRAEFPEGTLSALLRLIDGCGFDTLLCADTYHQGFDFYYVRDDVPSPELAEYLRLNPGDGRLYPRMLTDPPHGVFGGFVMGTRGQMLSLEAEIHTRLPGQVQTHVLRSPKYTGFMCELMPAGVMKWSAVLQVAAAWGIGPERICAVGDDVNDVPMLLGAGLGVAMANAVPAAKQAADRVAPSHDEDGLVQVVEWLLAE